MTGPALSAPASVAHKAGGHRPDRTSSLGGEDAEAQLVSSATGLLRLFNQAGVLGPADVHTALRLARIGQDTSEAVQLALACAVRALRMGSVCIDLHSIHQTAFDDSEELIDVSGLPWPEPEAWIADCAASRLVTVGPDGGGDRPLRLAHDLLYLERYWAQEETVRTQLMFRRLAQPPAVDLGRLNNGLVRLFSGAGLAPGEPDRQQFAAALSALRWVSVLAGGPGTGKTTTVARLLALLKEQPVGQGRVALAAPTGKAAARLEQAVREATRRLPSEDRERLGDPAASTLHRLLGWLPGGRYRHHAENHLPYDVVVVDEMSMVSLTMMARLLEAVRPDARLILVGDPDQLSSVEAGAVLADITAAPATDAPGSDAPRKDGPRPSEPRPDDLGLRATLIQLTGNDQLVTPGAVASSSAPASWSHGVVQLTHTWRFGDEIGDLARAIRAGDADHVMTELNRGSANVSFVVTDPESSQPLGVAGLAEQVRAAGREVDRAAHDGDVSASLAGLDRHRLICAHRRGPFGVTRWGREAELWLTGSIPGYGREGEWYVGRPLLITANDYELGLYNGDTGVVVNTPNGVRAAFARGGAASLFAPVRLNSAQTVHAMTVHRAQGSQFRCISFILPPPDSPLLTRQLLYTAVTRASERVQIFGTEEAVRRAVTRPANRASGLRNRLG